MRENYHSERIKKINIPDDDVAGWMMSLREAGFSEEEIGSLMTFLNEEWAAQRLKKYVDEEVAEIKRYISRHFSGRSITEKQEAELRKIILQRLQKLTWNDPRENDPQNS